MNDFLDYMQCDPYFRHDHYGELTFSMLYAYSEKFVLVFSHDEVVHGKGSLAGKMPDTQEKKFANLPHRLRLYDGSSGKETSVYGDISARLDIHSQMECESTATYTAHRTYEPEGFRWINCAL